MQDATVSGLNNPDSYFKAEPAHPVLFISVKDLEGFAFECELFNNVCFGTFLARLARVC